MDYKERLERAKELYPTANADQRCVLECLFPELAENRDERILEVIKHCIESRYLHTSTIKGISQKECFAWLEKQGGTYTKKDVDDAYLKGVCDAKQEIEKQGNKETLCDKCKKEQPSHSCQDITANGRCYIEGMNTSNNVEPKFKVGDWITNGEYTWKVIAIQLLDYMLDYILQSQDGNVVNDTISYVDKDFHLWTIQDAKDGDVLACGDKITDCPFIFHNLTKELNPRSYCGINKLLHFQHNDENGGFWCHSYEVKPATKEQRDILFAKMKEAGYEWDADKKE